MNQDQNRSDAAPGGKRDGAAGDDMAPLEIGSVGGSPAGEAGGGAEAERGPASEGSFGSGTYNNRGRVGGPDSPAGSAIPLDAGGEGQGDDLVNRLGGGEGTGAGLSGLGAGTGDMSAARSEGPGGSEPDVPSAGDVGGMGGAAASSAGSGRPNGGVSPVQGDEPNGR